MNYFQSVSLATTMAGMRLKSEASNLALSYLWWVLEPLLFVAVFYLVFEKFLSRGGEGFILFLMVGKIPFLWFSKTVNSSANALISGKSIMGQADFPKHIFPYVVVQENSQKQWVVFLALFAFVVLNGCEITINWLFIPLVILANYLLILAASMISAWIVVFLRDFRMIINMGTMFLMFTSGIFWDINSIPNEQTREMLLNFNPLAFILDAYRKVLLYGLQPDYEHLLKICLFSLFMLVLLHVIYKSQSQKIARKVLG